MPVTSTSMRPPVYSRSVAFTDEPPNTTLVTCPNGCFQLRKSQQADDGDSRLGGRLCAQREGVVVLPEHIHVGAEIDVFDSVYHVGRVIRVDLSKSTVEAIVLHKGKFASVTESIQISSIRPLHKYTTAEQRVRDWTKYYYQANDGVTASFCPTMVAVCDLPKHNEDCPNVVTTCDVCRRSLKRSELHSHCVSCHDCGSMPIPCTLVEQHQQTVNHRLNAAQAKNNTLIAHNNKLKSEVSRLNSQVDVLASKAMDADELRQRVSVLEEECTELRAAREAIQLFIRGSSGIKDSLAKLEQDFVRWKRQNPNAFSPSELKERT